MDEIDTDPKFIEELRLNLMKCLRDEDTFEYMGDNKKWKELLIYNSNTND